MAGKHQGQILYLSGSTSHGSPGGSLSTRFQKISQARSSGITVVNQPQVLAPPAQGRGLGLGHNTGSRTSGPRGQSISSAAANSSSDRRGYTNLPGGGIQTAGGLARAMQERGTGVTDAFLFAPSLAVGGDHGGPRRRGPGPPNSNYIHNNGNNSNNHHSNTQASRHKAMMLGARPGKKQNGGPGGPSQAQQGAAGWKAVKGPRRGVAPTPVAPANRPRAHAPKQQQLKQPQQQAGSNKKGKGPKGKPAPANAAHLDSELSEYMMKNEQTAASLLDNDLDSYMADKLEDNAW